MDPRAVPKRFAADEAELGALGLQLKQWRCPHCGREGALIGHGWLRGYAEHGGEGVIRGRRVFCLNRFRRGGCGRTFSVLIASVLRGFVVRAGTLYRFASEVLGGRNAQGGVAVCGRGGAIGVERIPAVAAAGSGASVAPSAAVPESAPPDCVHDEPLAGLLAHFAAAFPGVGCVLSAYQLRAERDLFE